MANFDLDYEGSEVQDILDTGKSLEDDGYIFLGTATPSTIPGTPTERVAYVGGPGTYNNFGTTVVVPSGSIVAITYSGSAWSKTVINASLPVSTTLGSDNTTIPTSKAVKDVTDAINNKLGEGYLYAGIATAATNPGTPTVKVFYLARQAGTYTNFGGLTLTEGVNILKYNGTAWSQEQLISIADIYKNPLMGYYECDTAGATAAKTVAATGYVLPATGGSIKIKMANRNTVANATLNINSTGAKPLYYNGQRAGVGNTWDTNEIVEVFYDGTNYQAYNVAGSNGDGVFDISAYNLTDGQPTPYVDLAAALGTNGEHVPQSLRKGGMSVKFIQGSVPSSDNNYVRFRLMAQSFTTDTTKWQGVVSEPIQGSKDLIESGGVSIPLDKILNGFKKTYNVFYGNWVNAEIKNDGTVVYKTTGRDNLANLNPMPVSGSTLYTYKADSVVEAGVLYVSEYDSSDSFLLRTSLSGSGVTNTFTTDANTRFIRLYIYKNNGTVEGMIPQGVRVYAGSDDKPYVPYYLVDWHALDYEHLTQVYATNEIVGSGNEGASRLYSPDYPSLKRSVKNQIDTVLSNFIISNNLFTGIWENARIDNSGNWIDMNTGLNNIANRTFIPVDPSSDYTIGAESSHLPATPSTLYVAEYDENKAVVTDSVRQLGTSTQRHTFTVSVTTKYVRFFMYLNNGNVENMKSDYYILVKGDTLSDYIRHFLIDEYNIQEGVVTSILKKENILTQTKNVVPETLVFKNARIDGSGVYYDLSTGLNNAASDVYIPVKSARTYMLSTSNKLSCTLYIVEYNSSKTHIRYTSYSIANKDRLLFTVSNTTIFIRIATYLNNAVWTTICPQDMQIELGGEASAYTKQFGFNTAMIDDFAVYDKMAESGLVNPRFDVPYYYFWNNYLPSKVSHIKDLLLASQGNGDAFVFITDMHWQLSSHNSPSVIHYLFKELNISKLIDGGDDDNNANYIVPKLLRQATDRQEIHHVVGNHDIFYPTTDSMLAYNYDMYRRDQIGNAERHYYYVDDAQRKFRYIVLAAYKPGDSQAQIINEGYEDAQYNWFVNEALNVESGWKIIVASHAFFEILPGDEDPETHTRPYNDYAYIAGAGRFVDAINNYNGNGEILFMIQGHAHLDRIIKKTKITGEVKEDGKIAVITTCDKYMKWDGTDIPFVQRELGTRTEIAFDVVVVDYTNGTATFVRIGARALDGVDDNVGTEVEERVISFREGD